MPTFQYEAMDNTGLEIKDTIEAESEQEAQTLIREKGFFVTKISEKGRRKKQATKGDAKAPQKPRRRGAADSPSVACAPNSSPPSPASSPPCRMPASRFSAR